MEATPLSTGERLRNARLHQGWTQEYLARELGVDPVTVGRWERNEHKPVPIIHQALCTLLGKTKEDLGLTYPSSEQEKGSLALLPLHSPSCLLEDASLKFRTTDLSERLQSIVYSWLLHTQTHASLRELEARLLFELQQKDQHMHESTRREALQRLASLPITVCGLSVYKPVIIRPIEEILTHCAAGITACWELRKGKELVFAFDSVSWYLPTLREIVKTASQEAQRKEGANLLTQCLSLQSSLAKHVTTLHDGIVYAEEATKYGRESGNAILLIRVLIQETSIYSYANQWKLALNAARQAKHVMEKALKREKESIPLIAQSFVYAHLASCLAYAQEHQEALRTLQKAHTTFSSQSTHECVPVYINHTQANLMLQDGLVQSHLGLSQKAFDSFGQIMALHDRAEEIHVEALIQQASAEARREDKDPSMEQCIDLWSQGIEGAKLLGSQQRYHEAMMVYAMMGGLWRKEQLIKNLHELTIWENQYQKHA